MKIFVTGTRGIPNIPGGVESHSQQLYPLIVKQGHQVRIARRPPYVKDNLTEWEGVELKDVFSPKKKTFEAIIHTFLSIIEAKKWKADIVHIHAIGPAIMVPFARMLGLNVVLTHHGPDYDRDKWGKAAKFILKLGEKLGGIFANKVIVISEVIRRIINNRCKRESDLVYNGVKIPTKAKSKQYLSFLGIEEVQYILAVARFVPEKGLHDLVDAFNKSNLNCKLVIAGDSDHEDKYSLKLKEIANNNPNIILTGFITGEKLNEIFSNANLFVLPSYHEGLPIALLEALSYGITPLVSDIPANLEVPLGKKHFFKTKNVEQLKTKLEELMKQENQKGSEFVELVKKKYDWQVISKQTIGLYEEVLNSNKKIKASKEDINEQL